MAGGVGLVAGALTCSCAQAAPVTVGQLFAPEHSCVPNFTFFQTSISSGNSYTVPVSGTITSWSFEDGATPVTGLKLKIGSATGGGNYTVVAESAAGAQTANTVNTYLANIAVQAGDIIGIYDDGGNCASSTIATSSDVISYVSGDAPVGSNMAYSTLSDRRAPLSVTVKPTPGISSISPASGSIKGGTSVTISGHDFTGASSVSFGGKPAASFTVNSDTQITAVSPAGTAPGAVDVAVTTGGGTTPTVAGDKYTYTACVVPKLKGKNLKKAKKALKTADCKLGKVKPKHQKKGHVKKQTPKSGTVLAPGSKVNIKL